MTWVIGIDFDNTIVSYDDLFFQVTMEKGLIPSNTLKSKKQIRDSIRELTDGDIKWQKIQGVIYGPMMHKAKLIKGVYDFIKICNTKKNPVFIVSHKTEFANYDNTRTNLRTAAMKWLDKNGFFLTKRLGLSPDHVFFQSTRQDKINRIKSLGCTHFIDDLEETFLEVSFPEKVEKILFDPHDQYKPRPGVKICGSWDEITKILLQGEK